MSVCCSKLKINPLFDDIKEGDYAEPAKKLAKHYKNVDRYTRLGVDESFKMMYYIMCRPKMKCYITRKPHSKLKKEAAHCKIVKMKPTGIMYLMFQLLTVRFFFKEAKERVALFKTTDTLYAYFVEGRVIDIPQNETCYQSWNFLELITAAKLILPENNKWYLENSKFERLTQGHFYKGFKTFNTVTVWMYKTFSLLELERFYFFSGIFWQYLGVRPIGDLDIIVSKEGSELLDTNSKLINRLYTVEDGKYYQPHDSDEIRSKTDVFLEGIYWHPFWDHLYARGSKALYPHIKKPEQFMFEPDCFVYFYGFKCSNPELSILNRYIRNRPRGTAELIMANEILHPVTVQVPPLPTYFLRIQSFAKGGDEEIKYTKYTDYEADFVKQNKTFTAKEFKKHIVPVDEKQWLNTIKWYLKRDYRNTKFTSAKLKEFISQAPKFDLYGLGIISKKIK